MLGLFCGLILFIVVYLRIGRKEDKPTNNINYLMFDLEREKLNNKWKQKREDRQFERDARTVAFDNWMQYQKMSDFIFNGVNYGKINMIISKPIRFTYCIYDEDTAKYKSSDFDKMVKDEFEKIKEEHKCF